MLAPFWRQLGQLWHQLGPTWRQHGASWPQLGPTCSQLGPTWGQLGAQLRSKMPPRGGKRGRKKGTKKSLQHDPPKTLPRDEFGTNFGGFWVRFWWIFEVVVQNKCSWPCRFRHPLEHLFLRHLGSILEVYVGLCWGMLCQMPPRCRKTSQEAPKRILPRLIFYCKSKWFSAFLKKRYSYIKLLPRCPNIGHMPPRCPKMPGFFFRWMDR